jgi:hypothetical protein
MTVSSTIKLTLLKSAAMLSRGPGPSAQMKRFAIYCFCYCRALRLLQIFRSLMSGMFQVPGELLAYLRLINCQGEDAFHLEALFRDVAWQHHLYPVRLCVAGHIIARFRML